MIPEIVNNHPMPKKQDGDVVLFKRRRPEESALNGDMSEKEIFDYIRMLYAEEYPHAFIEFGQWKLEFTDVAKDGKNLIAKVEFTRGKNE